MEKVGDIILDVVKYVATAMLVYPFLDGMEKDWQYYTLVSAGVIVFAALGIFLHYYKKKDKKNKKNNKRNNN
jgi:hypothetical protein